jgi:thioredoxin 1
MKANFDSIINSYTPTLIDFFAEWCGPCKVQSPILKEMAGELGGKVKVIKIDVDKNSEIASRYQIQSVPTLILFKNGKAVWRQSGLLTKPQLYTVLLQNT